MGGFIRSRKGIKCIFLVYILVVIKVIIFKYPYEQLYGIMQTWHKDVILEGLGTANFIPFKTIRMYIEYAHKLNSFENLAGNIIVFVPFGILFPNMWKKKRNIWDVFAAALALVLSIEVFQLFSAFGAFDVDDILLNCLGAVLGYAIYRLGSKCYLMFPSIHKKEKTGEEEYGAYLKEN